MKKFKKILTTIIFMGVILFSKSIMANPYTPGSQAWHNLNAALQAEQDRINQERQYQQYQQKQYSQPKQPRVDKYSIIVWNDKTGVYIVDIWDAKYATGPSGLVSALKKEYKNETGETANRSINWRWKGDNGQTAVVVIGRNIKSSKWEMYYDYYGPSWEASLFKEFKEFEMNAWQTHLFAFEDNVKKKLLNKCKEKSEYCQVIYSAVAEGNKRK